MTDDAVELVPVSDQPDDEAIIYMAWEDGVGLRALSRQFGISIAQVEKSLDRMLPAFDAPNQLRAFKRELRRLESLSNEFFTLAKRDHDRDSCHLVARLNERLCAMRGWNSPMKMDPFVVEVAEKGDSFTRIREAIMRLRQQPNGGNGQLEPPNGDGSPPAGSGVGQSVGRDRETPE